MAIAYGGPGFGYAPAPPKKQTPVRTTNTMARSNTSQAVRPQVTATAPRTSSAVAQPVNSTYGSYLQGFGGAEGYAKAIREKQAAGQTLSNPTAAAQFMQDRPDLFQQSQDNSGGNGGGEQKNDFMDWLTGLMTKVNESVNAPVATYTPAPVTGLSWEQAQAQAGQRLDPMFSQERRNLGQTTQQQRELLTQMMNAKNQLRGGGIIQGNVDLAGQLLEALADIGSRRATGVADLASSLQQQDSDRARQQEETNFNIWKANQDQNQNKISNLMDLLGVAQGQSQFDQTFDEGKRQFDATNALSWAEFNRPYSELTAGEKAEIDLRNKELSEQITSNRNQEGISRGNLGVAQGNLALGRDKFAYDQTQGQAEPTKGEAYDSAYSTLESQIAKGTATEWLIKNRAALVDTLGIAEYNKMVQYANDGG